MIRSAPARFGPDRRLRTSYEFREAQTGAARVHTEPFIVLLNKRKEAGAPSRLGLVASRKVGNAVRRNRIKRLLREAFRTGLFGIPEGTNVVVICRAGLADMTLSDVEKVLSLAQSKVRKALAKLGLIESERSPQAKASR